MHYQISNSVLSLVGIIFCVALSEYDTVLDEDPQINRMTESFQLFKTIYNNKWLSTKPLILFLNKTDLLKKKINHSPLKKHFQDYEGPSTYEGAIEYIKNQFIRLRNKSKMDNYVHLTCAIDTENIETVFNITSEIIIKFKQKKCGLY